MSAGHGSNSLVFINRLLALVRKFIILDIYETRPAVVFALAAASLALGVVLRPVRIGTPGQNSSSIGGGK